MPEQKLDIKKQEPMIPGICQASGLVLCPLFKGPCMKGGCEWWVELNYTNTKVARCSLAWLAILSTETRASIDRLKEGSNVSVDNKTSKG